MQTIEKLYSIHSGVNRVLLLGAAPCLKDDLEKVVVEDSDLIIGLNSVFMSKHKIDYLFFSCRVFVGIYQSKLQKHMPIIHADNLGNFGHDQEFVYRPVWGGSEKRDRRLAAGHSVLVPALNFATLLQPKSILLLGVDMSNNGHWYGKGRGRVNRRFPCYQKIKKQVSEVIRKNRGSNIFSVYRDGLLVRDGVLKCL